MRKTNWSEAVKPLLKKYKWKKHPLEYKNMYQLVVMVVLAAQATDKLINQIAPALFTAFPTMESLSRATPESLHPYVGKVRNFVNKTNWLLELSEKIKKDKNIPLTMKELTALPGIGRKSANVMMHEAHVPVEGVIIDLHVLRVAPRLGIASGTDQKKIEKQIMDVIPAKSWGDIGMALSFLGREICRPKDPKHSECVMKNDCAFYKAEQ